MAIGFQASRTAFEKTEARDIPLVSRGANEKR